MQKSLGIMNVVLDLAIAIAVLHNLVAVLLLMTVIVQLHIVFLGHR